MSIQLAERKAGSPQGGKPDSIKDGKIDTAKTVEIQRVKPESVPMIEGKLITQKDVDCALRAANEAVAFFARQSRRHTNAVKCVHDYMDNVFKLWAQESKIIETEPIQVLANVEAMLAKLGNWNTKPAWIKPIDRGGIIQSNGFSKEQIRVFDAWYEDVSMPFKGYRQGQSPTSKLHDIKEHLQTRVAVESVKNYLMQRPDIEASLSAIIQKGFAIACSGILPDGTALPEGSSMIVFERRTFADGEKIVPFAKLSSDKAPHIQWFDADKIRIGENKREGILKGPQTISKDDLYGFRLDHDPGRLRPMSANEKTEQVGFAFMAKDGVAKPEWGNSKNIIYTEGEIPCGVRARSEEGPGTNTGVLFNLLRKAYSYKPAETQGQPPARPATPAPTPQGTSSLVIATVYDQLTDSVY